MCDEWDWSFVYMKREVHCSAFIHYLQFYQGLFKVDLAWFVPINIAIHQQV